MRTSLMPFCVFALLVLFLSNAHAHPFAVTTAEVEYNAESRCFEVALRIYPEQLEQALSKETGNTISLERMAEIDPLITRYLNRRFTIDRGVKASKQKDDKPASTIRWVGKEVSPKSAWIYFEVPFEGPLDGIVVKNSIFFEINPEQMNSVHFKAKDRVASVSISPREPQSRVRWQSKDKAKPGRVENTLKF